MIRFLVWLALGYVLVTAATALLRIFVRPRRPPRGEPPPAPEPGGRVMEARWEEIPAGSREAAPGSKEET